MKVFVSYNQADRSWAAWIAWQLEAEGHEAILQAWDFAVGSNFVLEMQRALREADRTVAVLSNEYLGARFPAAEWAAAFATDPEGRDRRLVPVRVAACQPEGLLGTIVYQDLVGLDETAARRRLRQAISGARLKPSTEPPFPPAGAAEPPPYPGTGEPPPDDPATESYSAWARERHRGLNLIGVGGGDVRLELEEIYVPLRISRRALVDLDQRALRRDGLPHEGAEDDIDLEATLELEGGPHAVIFGQPGAGKTTALLKLHHQCFSEGGEVLGLDAGTVPLFLPLRHLGGADLSLPLGVHAGRYLEEASGGEIAADRGAALWQRGRLLLLLDGLDEIADDRERGEVASYLAWQLDSARDRGVRAVVSCRHAGYGGRVELAEGFSHLEVRPLDAEQVRRLVELWFREAQRAIPGYPEAEARRRSSELVAALEGERYSSQKLKVLVGSPLLLTLLCVVVLRGGEMPRQRVEFYDQCLRVLLGRWRKAKGIEPLLDPETALAVLRPLAWRLHAGERRDDLSPPELANQVRKRLRHLGQAVSPFRVVDWLHRDTGVLAEYAPSRFGFLHLGFQEYLAASHAASRSDELLDVLAAEFGERWWREVVLLLVALPGHRMLGPLSERVLCTDALAENADLLGECLAEAPEVDLDPFLRVLDDGDPGSQAAVLRLLRGRSSEALVERAQDLAASPSADVAALARQVLEEGRGGEEASKRPQYDFFLLHDPADAEAADELRASLKKRGLRLFEAEDWEAELEDLFAGTRSAVALAGPHGAAWERSEICQCLEFFAGEERPIVPALLPGVEELPELPEDLPWRTLVDLRTVSGTGACQALERAAFAGEPAAALEAPAPGRPVARREVLHEPRTKIRFLWVPGGTFEMGGEERYDGKPVHRVTMSPFYLAETSVSNRQYGEFLEGTGRAEPKYWRDRRFSDPDQPVVGVSWHDAVAFCEWLSPLLGHEVQLPSEAQWEFAARGTDGRTYPWGEEDPDSSRACFEEGQPARLGSFPSGRGPFGHLDLAGNVWEWCRDVWNEEAYAERAGAEVIDPVVTAGDQDFRVLRGGGWSSPAGHLRAAYRSRNLAAHRWYGDGFRVSAAPASLGS